MDEGDEAGYFILSSSNGARVSFNLPLSGVILNHNPLLINRPNIWRNDPYGFGWLFAMEAADPADIRMLLNHRQYNEMAELLSNEIR